MNCHLFESLFTYSKFERGLSQEYGMTQSWVSFFEAQLGGSLRLNQKHEEKKTINIKLYCICNAKYQLKLVKAQKRNNKVIPLIKKGEPVKWKSSTINPCYCGKKV